MGDPEPPAAAVPAAAVPDDAAVRRTLARWATSLQTIVDQTFSVINSDPRYNTFEPRCVSLVRRPNAAGLVGNAVNFMHWDSMPHVGDYSAGRLVQWAKTRHVGSTGVALNYAGPASKANYQG
eukprot:2645293-Pyramimonas_sp.AAC.1